MRAFNIQVFDDMISGTTTAWYSSAEHNAALGSADALAIGAMTYGVSGTPLLTVQVEHSCDGKNWLAVGSAQISSVTIGDNQLYAGNLNQYIATLLTFARLKVTLSGTPPVSCRLKLYVTGRTNGRLSGSARAG